MSRVAPPRRPRAPVTTLSFNQDRGCFTCCLESGLRIYNIEPLVEKARYSLDKVGDVVLCEMLYRSNLLFLVKRSRDSTLSIYDDIKSKFISEITFPSAIKSIRVRKDKLAIALEFSIYLVRWQNGSKAQQVLQTPSNPMGLCEITTLPGAPKRLLVAPGHKIGSVQLMELDTSAAVHLMSCHSGAIRCISLSASGSLLATASERGTLLRVWCTRRKNILYTFRRGSDHATLFCMNFSRGGELLCCCSDKGTLHIFQLGGNGGAGGGNTTGSSLIGSGGALLIGERALAQGSLPREQPALCAFISNTSVAAICIDGTFHKYVFTNEGACHRESFDIYLEVGDDDDFIT